VQSSGIDRVIDVTEKAAGIFLAAIAALTFMSVVLRVFSIAIPDWYDISRLMLGVTVFWGIASTCYRNEHIQVDVLWEWVGPQGKRIIDGIATVILLAFLAAFAWMLFFKVDSGFRSGESTFDTRMPVWPFHALAAFGIVLATLLTAVRLYRIVSGKSMPAPRPIEPVQ
jgi:TRAP-type C4-dicarboxylate transport system permease small subunit